MSPFWIKASKRLHLLQHLYTSTSLQINNTRFTVPIMGGWGFANLNPHEPWMTRLLQQLKPIFNGYFTDIGINMGQTLMKAHAVFGEVNYTGFEPNTFCIHYIRELLRLNNFPHCQVVPVGISNQTEILKLDFYTEDEGDQSASIVNNFRPGEEIKKSWMIPVFNNGHLDPFLPRQKNSLLKIDVEGAELEVLQGIYNWVRDYQPIIIVEVLPVYRPDNLQRLERQKQLEQLLLGLQYAIFRIHKTEPLGLKPLKEIGIHGNIEDSDYIFCPQQLGPVLQQNFKD